MESSKCCQVESPSPFRFFAALMPPCAHTECERFTGTMENNSTGTPDSAMRIVAISPARPPPTTMIFGSLMISRSQVPVKRLPAENETRDDGKSHNGEHNCYSGSQPTGGALRSRGDGDAPFAAKIPESVAEMKRSRENADNVKRDEVRIRERVRYDGVWRFAMREEAQRPDVPEDIGEDYHARPALKNVQPIGHPRMAQGIGLALPPDVQSVAAMERDGQPDEQELDENAPRNRFQLRSDVIVLVDAHESVTVLEKMLDEIGPNRNDAGEGMQLIQEITGVRFRRSARHPLSENVLQEPYRQRRESVCRSVRNKTKQYRHRSL